MVMSHPSSISLQNRPCPACGADSPEDTALGRDGWRVSDCGACGFTYMPQTPAQSDYAEAFAWDVTVQAEKARRKRKQPVIQWLDAKTRWRLHLFPRPETRRFAERLVETGPVLDLGCGDGRHAGALPDRFIPFGIEIAPRLAEAADAAFRVRGGRCVSADALSGLSEFNDAGFSAAMLNSYLEHELEPLPVLKALRPKMRPGAPVIVKVPNYGSWNAKVMGANWCGVRLPDHVNYFTFASLAGMAERAGFAVSPPPGGNLPTNDNMWAVLRA
jgi:SAM-dependent methyltransferase